MEASGWRVLTHLKSATSYDRAQAIFAEDLLAYVQETQPTEWAKFKKWHNGQSEQMFVKRVAKQLDTHGTLHLLRHGFKDVDAKFSLCQFKPAHDKNPKLVELYKKNHLTVIRQLHYSLNNEKSIDMVLFVNGLPVATAELKTDLTQSISAQLFICPLDVIARCFARPFPCRARLASGAHFPQDTPASAQPMTPAVLARTVSAPKPSSVRDFQTPHLRCSAAPSLGSRANLAKSSATQLRRDWQSSGWRADTSAPLLASLQVGESGQAL
jgi:hypothetical protein